MEGAPGIKIERDAVGSTLITGDGNVVVQFGLTSAPASFRGRVRRFLSYYLGSESRPVPFGGRGAQLGQLDAWLAHPDAPSNLLITAPAGRGKTALLVNWLQNVDAAAWPIAFVPISTRLGTNRPDIFYQALAARLAEVLGRDFDEARGDAAEVYKDKVIEQVDAFPTSGKRCLLVIDGLDEAAGWRLDTSVLPHDPARGLRIIASARLVGGASQPQDWLLRMGWKAEDTRSLEVLPLDRDGIADVLREMGVPLADLAGNVDILSELERLTEGDPLLLRFYVEDLWDNRDQAAGLRPEELRGREKGFAAYFRHWLSKQGGIYLTQGATFDEQTIKAILVVLACALGPLRLADIVHLVHRLLGPPRFITSDDLEPIKRFLIGGGSDESGYALGHPKLGEYLREYFFGASEDVARAQELFLAWGGDTVSALNAGKLPPEKTPPYLLQYYLQHLEESSASLDQFCALVEDGWRRAWEEARDGGFRGFTSDVQHVWTAIRRELLSTKCIASRRHQLLGAQIRCALCISSVRSLGVNIPAPLLGACLKHGILSTREGLHLAHLQDNASKRAEAFTAIVPHLEEPERSLALVEALDALEGASIPARTIATLATIAPHVGPALQAHLRSIADNISQQQHRAQALSIVALHTDDHDSRERIFAKVLSIARSLRNSSAKALLIAGLAIHRPDTNSELPSGDDLFSEAFAVATRLDNVSELGSLTQLALSASPFERHQQVVSAAIAAAHASGSPETKARGLVRLASLPGVDRATMTGDAIAAARSVPNLYQRICTLIAVASHLGDDRRYILIDEARTQADTKYFWHAVVLLVYYLASELDQEDIAYINSLMSGYSSAARAELNTPPLCIATDLARTFGVWQAPTRWIDILAPVLSDEPLRGALRASQLIHDIQARLQLLYVIIEALCDEFRPEAVNYAWSTAYDIKDSGRRTAALRELAPYTSPDQHLEIFNLAMAIDDNDTRAAELSLLASYIPGGSLNEALAAIQGASDPLRRARALVKLVPRLVDREPDEVLGELLASVTAGSDNPGSSAELALEIALGHSKQRRQAALDRALAFARGLSPDHS